MSQWTIWGTLDPSSSSRGDSPALTSPRREGAWDSSEESAVPYGWRCLELSGLAHRLGSSLRTFLLSACAGLTPSSLAWKRRATPRGRWWWVLGRSGRHTGEIGSGSLGGEWATPRASENENRTTRITPSQVSGKHGQYLAVQVLGEWPTPTAEPYGSNRGGSMGREGQPVRPSLERAAREWPSHRASDGEGGQDLRTAVQEWPTPTARDWRSTAASPETHERNSRPLSEVAGLEIGRARVWMARTGQPGGESHSTNGNRPGSLNPDWVEALMGVPPGWTDLPVETASALWATRTRRTSRS